MKKLVLVTLIALASCQCATVKEAARTAAKDFYDCTTAELAKDVAALTPAVAPAVKQAAATKDWSPITARGKSAAVDAAGDALRCAIVTAGTAFARALELAPKTHAQEVSPLEVRAGVREVAIAAFGGAHFRTADGDL
jgi:hypothetical protein